MGKTTKRISSPISTGGGGNEFERHTDTYWLALLAVRSIPPILIDCVIEEVHLQAEHLGWDTDDTLIVGRTATGDLRRLACQVKRSFRISANDSECCKTIIDFWGDFHSGSRFDPESDRLAVVTMRGTNRLLGDFGSLLQLARSSRDADDFARRLSTPGMINTDAISDCDAICQILSVCESRAVSRQDVWPFLKALHILSFDLASETKATESHVKAMLAIAANGTDRLADAETSWKDLLVEVGDGMQNAKSYRREDLPPSVQERIGGIDSRQELIVTRMREHSQPILANIHTTINGEFHLDRDEIVQKALNSSLQSRIVVITGPAGSGKSAIAKEVFVHITEDCPGFCLGASELARPHIDETLVAAHLPANHAELAGIFVSQRRKLVLVESVERLLEAADRAAFAHLLQMVEDDPTWQLILTCRDYSSAIVQSSLLARTSVGYTVVEVPKLTDAEVDAVAGKFPIIKELAASEPLRRLLRSPFVLSKVISMKWDAATSLPATEREFRRMFWSQIVRADDQQADGMPGRRESVFLEICVERAKRLTESVSIRGQDEAATVALRNDSLLSHGGDGPNFAFPSHDVLEDWAIIHWIEDHFRDCESQILELQQRLSTAPAIRRGYRKWLNELAESDETQIAEIFADVVNASTVDQGFADDTIIAILKSSHVESFLVEHETMLLSQDKALLRRVIHLTRMACRMPPPYVAGGWNGLIQQPVGRVWCTLLGLIEKHIADFGEDDLPLLVGFVEEASMAEEGDGGYPDGAESMVSIAWSLLPLLDNFSGRAQQKRLLGVIARFPRCQAARFLAKLSPERDDEEVDDVFDRDDFLELLFFGFQGVPSCRDFPAETLAAFLREVTADQRELDGYQGVGIQQSVMFGLTHDYHRWSHYASAYNGPFNSLLQFHPDSTLDELIRFVNGRAERYATRPITNQYLSRPDRVSVELPDDTTVEQWFDRELWTIYRGRTGPVVLQSALMALERWLLNAAERSPDLLDNLLLKILAGSNSCAITAVVAAVAAAHPRIARETVYSLLGSPQSLWMDHYRFALDQTSPPTAFSLPTHDPIRDVFLSERRSANQQPHRLRDIETAVFELQFGPDRERIQKRIDTYLDQLPEEGMRSDADLDWLMALRRMDLRHRTISEVDVARPASSDSDHEAPTTRYVKFELELTDESLQDRSDKADQDHQSMEQRIGLLMWGMKAFERDADSSIDPAKWKESLQAAMSWSGLENGEYDPAETAPAFIAAVCVRDHAIELSPEEFGWCVNTICAAIEKTANEWGPLAATERHAFEGDIPAANVIAKLVGYALPKDLQTRVMTCFASAMTHPDQRVIESCAIGVGEHLFSANRALAERFVHAINYKQKLIVKHVEDHRKSEFGEGPSYEQRCIQIANEVRNAFVEDTVEATHLVDGQFTQDHIESLPVILSALVRVPRDPLAVPSFLHASTAMVHWWELMAADRRGRRDAPVEILNSLRLLLSQFLLQCDQSEIERVLAPILDAASQHPEELELLLLAIIERQCEMQESDNFWIAWELFASVMRSATWLPHVDEQGCQGAKLMRAVFLSENWAKLFRPWEPLEGNESRIHDLLSATPPSVARLESYVNYLSSVGVSTCPESFVQLAEVIDSVPMEGWRSKPGVVSTLELLLQRFVYAEPVRLKRNPKIRSAVLILLDRLVQAGSSIGYQMRDDFVTPLPAED